jgi:hypothetical protein
VEVFAVLAKGLNAFGAVEQNVHFAVAANDASKLVLFPIFLDFVIRVHLDGYNDDRGRVLMIISFICSCII